MLNQSLDKLCDTLWKHRVVFSDSWLSC